MEIKKMFIFIGVFWILIFGGFIGFKEYTLRTGQEVLLKTLPVDPRDLFRGDYVILTYDINTIDTNTLSYDVSDFKIHDTVYAILDIDDDTIGTLSALEKKKPSENIFIKGRVTNIFQNTLHIEYGIESYFVEEGKGRNIERNLGEIYTKIAVDNFGNAVIRSLVLDSKDILH
jgi:uncharacterized membrane-anchored protein